MKVMMPCETAAKYVLPAIRARIAKDLTTEHKFTQKSIASILGVTQPAVSKYLSDDYDEKMKSIMKDSNVRKVSKELVELIAHKKIGERELNASIMKSCAQIIKDNPNVFDQ